MFRPSKRKLFLTLVLIMFFPLYGCMVIAPLSLITLSFLSTKVPTSWWLVAINPIITVGAAFNYFLACLVEKVFIKRLSTEKSRYIAAATLAVIIAVIPFVFRIYGWAGSTGEGEWANFIEFYRKSF